MRTFSVLSCLLVPAFTRVLFLSYLLVASCLQWKLQKSYFKFGGETFKDIITVKCQKIGVSLLQRAQLQ